VTEYLGGPRAAIEFLALEIWSLVHGAAVLRQKHLRDFSRPIVEATRHNLERLLEGWRPVVPAACRSPPRLARGDPA
jgi:hypothetical protein